MWTCSKCGRIFQKKGQVHSCRKYPIEKHFKNKELARDLYLILKSKMENQIGECKEISLPCCIHLFGTYDFIALLPKKDSLEVRFALDKKLKDIRIEHCVPLSKSRYKNCLHISSKADIDKQLLSWLKRSYDLK